MSKGKLYWSKIKTYQIIKDLIQFEIKWSKITNYLYLDPEDTLKKLGYNREGLKEAITKTMKACYPGKFKDLQER
jgi:hypothetical protein